MLNICTDKINKNMLPQSSFATFEKTRNMKKVIGQLSIQEKRRICALMRTDDINLNTFFPKFGVDAVEFATYEFLTTEKRKRQGGSNKSSRKKI